MTRTKYGMPTGFVFPDDWIDARNFNPTNGRQMLDWAIYIKNGVSFVSEHLGDEDFRRREAVKILNVCIQVCQNVIDTGNELDRLEKEDMKKAEKAKRRLL